MGECKRHEENNPRIHLKKPTMLTLDFQPLAGTTTPPAGHHAVAKRMRASQETHVMPCPRTNWAHIATESGTTNPGVCVYIYIGIERKAERQNEPKVYIQIYIYICCEVIIWSKFRGFWKLLSGPSWVFGSYLVQVCVLAYKK